MKESISYVIRHSMWSSVVEDEEVFVEKEYFDRLEKSIQDNTLLNELKEEMILTIENEVVMLEEEVGLMKEEGGQEEGATIDIDLPIYIDRIPRLKRMIDILKKS